MIKRLLFASLLGMSFIMIFPQTASAKTLSYKSVKKNHIEEISGLSQITKGDMELEKFRYTMEVYLDKPYVTLKSNKAIEVKIPIGTKLYTTVFYSDNKAKVTDEKGNSGVIKLKYLNDNVVGKNTEQECFASKIIPVYEFPDSESEILGHIKEDEICLELVRYDKWSFIDAIKYDVSCGYVLSENLYLDKTTHQEYKNGSLESEKEIKRGLYEEGDL